MIYFHYIIRIGYKTGNSSVTVTSFLYKTYTHSYTDTHAHSYKTHIHTQYMIP